MKSNPNIFTSHPFSAEIDALISTGLSVFVTKVESKIKRYKSFDENFTFINNLKQEEMGLFYFYVFKRLAYYTFVYIYF